MLIEWTVPALSDIQNIKEYIERDSKYYAYRFIGKIIAAVEKLALFPNMGRIVFEAEEENIRELLFQNYRIIYRVEYQRILVLTIFHATRDLSLTEPKPWDVA